MGAVIEGVAVGAGVDNLMGAVSGAVAVISLDAVIRAAAVIFQGAVIEGVAVGAGVDNLHARGDRCRGGGMMGAVIRAAAVI